MSAQQTTEDTRNFFCHSCQLQFLKNPEQEFVCPRCQNGFVEELPENIDSDSNQQQQQQQQDDEQTFRVFNDFTMGPFHMASGNNNSPYYRIANEILAPIITGSLAAGSSSNNSNGEHSDGARRRSQRRNGPINFEDILQEILVSISDGNNTGRTPMFFMGNPGDYAWGREGLDTIVTQLLNQMDNAGPPPLEKEKIDEIPKCEITSDQVDTKLQCSVCWDNFLLNESVRKLPCAHVYHEGCILPWLELHGTCPICRKSLVPEDESANSMSNNAVANAVANQLRLSMGGSGQQASTSQSGNTTDTTNNSSNNSENRNSSNRSRRDDVEFDFD